MFSIRDAKDRRVVRLQDGRTGRLLSIPGNRSKNGAKARVILPSGAVLSVPVDHLEPETPQHPHETVQA